MYDKLKADKGAAEQNEINARKQLKLANDTADERELKLNDKINALNVEIDQLETQLTEAKREAVTATEEESKWKTATVEFYNTNERQRKLLEDTLAKLKAIQTDQIQGDQELKETTDTLIRKMAIISDLEKKLKLTLEEKTDMQNQLGQQLQKSGQTIAPPVTVTQVKETARVATPAVDIGLNGLISTVDLENSLAEISIGSANGVKQNMKFHVTRADKFICDIVILDVEPENAIGTLELIDATKEQPKAGDNVSTNL
jgi:chromosome segregation ATPase